MTDAWAMHATMRIAPWQAGQVGGSTSKICCNTAAQRRVASVGLAAVAQGRSPAASRPWPARRRSVRPVGTVGGRFRRPVVRQPLQRDGIPRAVPREPGGKGAVVFRHPDGRVHMQP